MPLLIIPSFLNGKIISLKELTFHILDYMNADNLKRARQAKTFYDRCDLRIVFGFNKNDSSPYIYNKHQQIDIDDSHEIEYVIYASQIQKCYYFIKGLIIQREDVVLFKIDHDNFLSEDSLTKNCMKDFDRISFSEKTLWNYFVHKGETDNFSLYFSFNIVNYVDPKNSLCLNLAHKNKVIIASQKLIPFLKTKYGEDYQLMKKEIKNEADKLFSEKNGFAFSKEEKRAIIINASTSNEDEDTIEEDETADDR